MPPKTTHKDQNDSITCVLMEQLKDNQGQQNARHAAIASVLHTITDKLGELRFFPPAPPTPNLPLR
ncbi:hypothetical protein Lal_00042624 [Lupinus albus]|nr:hypothetical protein Lal_00042624 [Lupinus albus]